MKNRSWRERSVGGSMRRWRPRSSFVPRRRQGGRINERRRVGIRDLVAAPSEVSHQPEKRWRVIGGFFLILLAVLYFRLYMLQVPGHAHSVAMVESNSMRVSTIPASRGEILDRNGRVMVGNISTTEVRLSRAEAAQNPEIIGALSSLCNISVASIKSALADLRYDPYQPAPVLLSTPPNLVEYLTLHSAEFPGVTLLNVSKRVYPLGGGVAPHVLGYVGPINGTELASRPNQGYQMDSAIGKSGVERFYEQFLRGHDGQRTLRVSNTGRILGEALTRHAVVGDSLVLNIDAGLQNALDGFLSSGINRVRHSVDPRSGKIPPAPNGAAIVMDVTNGHVLALSSYPSYDLNQFVGGLSVSQFHGLLQTGAFNNFAIQGLYTPGSTFKMITSTAQLKSGILAAGSYVNDTGVFAVPGCQQGYHGCLFHDDETSGAGMINLPLALTKSSDYYFYNLGYLFWSQTKRYGLTPIQDVATKFGLDQYSQIDLPNETSGRVDSPIVRQRLHNEAPKAFPNAAWYTGDNLQMAFGQGSTVVTPIAMLDAYATLANGGTRYALEVVNSVVSPTGRVIQSYGPKVLDTISLPPSVRNPIVQGLTGVVASPEGTAYWPFHTYAHFDLNAFPVAGKTGTASNAPGLEPNAWFVGFGPTNSPRYAILCVIGQGGYGASASAPVVAQAFDYLVHNPLPPVAKSINPSLAPLVPAKK